MPRKKKAPKPGKNKATKPRNYKPTNEQKENLLKIYLERSKQRLIEFWIRRLLDLGEDTEVSAFWIKKFVKLRMPADWNQDYFKQVVLARVSEMTVNEHEAAAIYARNLLHAYSDFGTSILLVLSEISPNSNEPRLFGLEIASFAEDLREILEICNYLIEECERLQCAHRLLSLETYLTPTDLHKLVACLRGIAAMQLLKNGVCIHATTTMDKSLDSMCRFDVNLWLIIQQICTEIENSHKIITSYELVDPINTSSNFDVNFMFSTIKFGYENIFYRILNKNHQPWGPVYGSIAWVPNIGNYLGTYESGHEQMDIAQRDPFYALELEGQHSIPNPDVLEADPSSYNSESDQDELYVQDKTAAVREGQTKNLPNFSSTVPFLDVPLNKAPDFSQAHRVLCSRPIEQPKFLMPSSKQASKKPLPPIQEFLLPEAVEPPECSKKPKERTVKIFK